MKTAATTTTATKASPKSIPRRKTKSPPSKAASSRMALKTRAAKRLGAREPTTKPKTASPAPAASAAAQRPPRAQAREADDLRAPAAWRCAAATRSRTSSSAVRVLLVQVVKEERGNKGAALTTYLSLAGPLLRAHAQLEPRRRHQRARSIRRQTASASSRSWAELELPPHDELHRAPPTPVSSAPQARNQARLRLPRPPVGRDSRNAP